MKKTINQSVGNSVFANSSLLKTRLRVPFLSGNLFASSLYFQCVREFSKKIPRTLLRPRQPPFLPPPSTPLPRLSAQTASNGRLHAAPSFAVSEFATHRGCTLLYKLNPSQNNVFFRLRGNRIQLD